MYSILLCAAVSLLLSYSGVLLDWWGWGWMFLFAPVLFIASWILLARRIAARLQPAMARFQQQATAGHLDAAMETLEHLLPYGKWVPMLRGQLQAQMGMLAWYGNKKEQALHLLEHASLRAADARLLLGCILHSKGDTQRALTVLQTAAMVNKKHSLLHNACAWILHRSERSDEAQQLLAAFVKRCPDDAPAKANLLRLQNRTRMSMQDFGMQWYMLGLEQPPQTMGQMRRAPKGFREPPKRRG